MLLTIALTGAVRVFNLASAFVPRSTMPVGTQACRAGFLSCPTLQSMQPSWPTAVIVLMIVNTSTRKARAYGIPLVSVAHFVKLSG